MVAGIILFAFGVKETLEHLGHTLGTVEALALCGGAALYLLAYVALRVRVTRSLGHGRPVAALACAVLIPVARAVPALAALALVACVLAALHTYELIRWRESRAQARMQRFAAPS